MSLTLTKCHMPECAHGAPEGLHIFAICVHEHIRAGNFCPCHYKLWIDRLEREVVGCYLCRYCSEPHWCPVKDITEEMTRHAENAV